MSPGIIAGVDFSDYFVVSEPAANQEHDDRRPLVTQLLACTSVHIRREIPPRFGYRPEFPSDPVHAARL
jgi:hypothetical protein